MEGRQGYTLAEVMTGLTIVGILAVATVPNVSSFLRSQNAAGGTEQLGAHLRMARSRAVLEGNDYLVQFTGEAAYVLVDDDGGGQGLPGAAGYVAANRGNGLADEGELVLGPYALPRDLRFASVDGARNPFNGESLTDAVSFPVVNGAPTVLFHANGTADSGGFVTISTQTAEPHGRPRRCRVLQVLSSTGGIEARPAQH